MIVLRRAMRPAAALLAACAVGVLVLPTQAGADTPYQFAWWNRVQVVAPGLGGVVPAPPTVPQGGLYVSGSSTSVTSISALRYAVEGAVDGVLKLSVASGSAAGAVIDACAITGAWAQGENQAFETAPTYDCAVKATGAVDAAGTTITWNIPAGLYRSELAVVDIVLVPGGPAPTQVAFAPADDSSFTHPPVEAATDAPPAESGALAPEGALGPAAEGSPSGSLSLEPATAPLREVGTPVETGAPDAPTGSRTGGGAAAFPLTPSQVASALTDDDSRPERIGAFVVLMLLAGALWLLGGRQVRAPRLLGGPATAAALTDAAGGAAAVRVGGIGRFARPRTAAPKRL